MSGLDPPKRGPAPPQLRPSPFFWCWTPFCAVSGLDPPKRGPPQPDLKLAPISTFSVASPHTEAVPVLALSVPCSLLLAIALCVADPVWIYLLCSRICKACPAYQGRLAQSVERKALNLKIESFYSDFSASEALVPILRLLALPHREQYYCSLFLSLSLEAVPMLSLHGVTQTAGIYGFPSHNSWGVS